MPSLPQSVWWAFLSAGLALSVILLALGAALVIYQRRFVAQHRRHAEGLLRAQEEERAWVAREVHDDALQRIALLVHELDGWNAVADAERVGALRGELEDLSVVLRRLANRLHPSFVEKEGLVPALRRLAGDLAEKSGVRLEVREERGGAPALSREQALVAFRVAQEALGNLIRHSGAREGHVLVRGDREGLELEVVDRGRGFAVAARTRAGSLGLLSMAERSRAAGGRLAVWSEPGEGTIVRLRLPAGNGR